ncbi:MAG: hypothetical protein K0R63_947 [Rickettsiales bacterium]|jgi:hypothetical protein|nr:hypothetical protein [Rickettsiales bacterium]
MPLDEANLQKIIKEVVFETLSSLGFTPYDPQETQKDMIYVRKLREGSEEIGGKIRTTLVTVCITSGLYLVWEAFKNAIR